MHWHWSNLFQSLNDKHISNNLYLTSLHYNLSLGFRHWILPCYLLWEIKPRRQGGPLLTINRPGGNELDQEHKEDRRMERNLATWRCRKVRSSGSSVNRSCFWVLEPYIVDRGTRRPDPWWWLSQVEMCFDRQIVTYCCWYFSLLFIGEAPPK